MEILSVSQCLGFDDHLPCLVDIASFSGDRDWCWRKGFVLTTVRNSAGGDAWDEDQR
jgi:hypothetical protein